MKIYIDGELPKDCIDCPCEVEYYCNLLNEDIGCLKWGEVHKNCPLQSISDYTKQVREEVCDDLCNEIEFIWGIHQEITITHIRDILRSYAERIEKGK